MAKQEVWPFRNQNLALSEPKFGPFGTLWIVSFHGISELRDIFGPVTYSVGNTINTRHFVDSVFEKTLGRCMCLNVHMLGR
jgi:hypothetical protein